MPITTREGLKDYCLRRLGYPVIEINVDDEQVEDRIQDALEFWNEYHFDGVEKVYLRDKITASTITFVDDISAFQIGELIIGETSGANALIYSIDTTTNTAALRNLSGTFADDEVVTGQSSAISKSTIATDAFVLGNWDSQYFEVSDAVTGVVRIFPIGAMSGSSSTRNLFDVIYQFRLNDLWSMMSADLIYYSQVKTYISQLDFMFAGARSFRFNRKQNRIFIDVQWKDTFKPGDWVVVEAYRILDPETWKAVYNDIFLKRYATALIKRQWGNNMKKFAGIQLPGGVTLNGAEIYGEAETEIQKIEEEMQMRYELPPDFQVG